MGVAAQQLIPDFGFEKGASATGWILEGEYSEGKGTSVVIKGDKVRTGKYALKGYIPTNNSDTTGVGARRQTETLTKGVTYTFSAYVNTSQAVQSRGKGLYLEVLYAGTSIARSNYVNDITSEKVGDGWTRRELYLQ